MAEQVRQAKLTVTMDLIGQESLTNQNAGEPGSETKKMVLHT